ncbi:hypothetical protein [Treponema sp.]|uniref:hypothetical protein n=1 Tax=Treponema sp. TaxID=166 RepID=UPI00388ED154
MSENTNLIEEFVEKKTLQALESLMKTDDENAAVKNAVQLADAFGLGSAFKKIAENKDEEEAKLTGSFSNNLALLIQKTWVEQSDEEMKAQVLYLLDEVRKQLGKRKYKSAYSQFISIVNDVVYLMFGNQTKSEDFAEYALRIDPEFGMFWWYFKSLPQEADWSEGKTRTALLLAMYFLANY